MKRKELFDVLKNQQFYNLSSSKCNEQLLQYIFGKIGVSELSEDLIKQIEQEVKVFVSKMFTKWRECNYMYERFNKKHINWLDKNLKLPEIQPPLLPLSVGTHSEQKMRGRPRKSFEESSHRSKQRHVRAIVSELNSEKLCLAAETSLVKSGNRSAAEVVKLAINSSPKSLKRMKLAHDTSSSASIKPYNPEEALALIVDLGLTKEDYITMRLGAIERGANIYPSYHVIGEAKRKCYPANIEINENEAVVPLQDLLAHTTQRLAQVQTDVILQYISTDCDTIEVYYKWGLDGSGGHSIYKQNFANNSAYADSNIILCTIVPLQMCESNSNNDKIFWKNMSPSSTKHCRPISFKIKKENVQNVKEEYNEIQNQILQLEPTSIVLDGKEIKFKHIPICTMLDGKTVNILSDTASSQMCNVCKATPKILNDLEKLKNRVCNEDTFKYGISVLHAHIRCYEYLLHIAYKLELQKWQARGDSAKQEVKEKKGEIATKFYEQMGLVVDQPKQGGGNSNDGNTARKFFKNPSLVSEITGIDKDLIERFANILSIISCGYYIKEEVFKNYCFETAEMAIKLYGWYKMSVTVHKILIHGADIIKSLPLPVGQLSEDVIEASHKEYKNLRQYHSRKTSRANTNSDIFNWMLVSSDPVVTDNRKKAKKK